MPNWVRTDYAVTGEREALDEMMKLFIPDYDKEPKIPNGFGHTWLGLIVNELGFNTEEISCRGWFEDCNFNEDGTLRIVLYTAWNEFPDFRHMLEERFGVNIFYYAEDEFWNFAITNDRKGNFFTERFLFEHNGQSDWYESEDEFLEDFNAEFVTECKMFEEAEKFLRDNVYDKEPYTDEHIFIGQVDVCDD